MLSNENIDDDIIKYQLCTTILGLGFYIAQLHRILSFRIYEQFVIHNYSLSSSFLDSTLYMNSIT